MPVTVFSARSRPPPDRGDAGRSGEALHHREVPRCGQESQVRRNGELKCFKQVPQIFIIHNLHKIPGGSIFPDLSSPIISNFLAGPSPSSSSSSFSTANSSFRANAKLVSLSIVPILLRMIFLGVKMRRYILGGPSGRRILFVEIKF